MIIYFKQTNIAPGTPIATGGGSNFNTINVSSIQGLYSLTGTLNTTTSNTAWEPIQLTLRPDQASDNGLVAIRTTWDAVDTGANVSFIAGATGSNAFIGAEWAGVGAQPIQVIGELIDLTSGEETFIHCDGTGPGNPGTVSTGTKFISAQNTLSSITDPTQTHTADMTLLLSTLQGLYPNCFS